MVSGRPFCAGFSASQIDISMKNRIKISAIFAIVSSAAFGAETVINYPSE